MQIEQPSSEAMKKLKQVEQLTTQLQTLSEQRRELQLLELMASPAEPIYVDQEKQFQVVKTQYLRDLEQRASSMASRIDQIERLVQAEHVERTLVNKVLDLKNLQIEHCRHLLLQSNGKLHTMQRNFKQLEDLLAGKENEYKQLTHHCQQQGNQLQRLQKQLNQLSLERVRNQQKFIQTEFEIRDPDTRANQAACEPINPPKSMQRVQSENQATARYNTELRNLQASFQTMLQGLSLSTAKKVGELEQEKLMLHELLQENVRLREQNGLLTEQLRAINEQEEKLRIWRTTLEGAVGNVEKDYKDWASRVQQGLNELFENSKSAGNLSVGASYLNEQKMKAMQSAIDRIQAQERQRELRAGQIRSMLESMEEGTGISEENIVGNLLGLSHKIKEVVRYLLEQL